IWGVGVARWCLRLVDRDERSIRVPDERIAQNLPKVVNRNWPPIIVTRRRGKRSHRSVGIAKERVQDSKTRLPKITNHLSFIVDGRSSGGGRCRRVTEGRTCISRTGQRRRN